ncbi:hypothetical protein ABPG75_009154 [Micractinium tetrahymenae]
MSATQRMIKASKRASHPRRHARARRSRYTSRNALRHWQSQHNHEWGRAHSEGKRRGEVNSEEGRARAAARSAKRRTSGTGEAGIPPLFVPDVKGADEARAWLQLYRRERQRRPEGMHLWPESVVVPSCNDTLAKIGGRRHLILSQVGDSWGMNETRNKWLDDPAFAAKFDVVVIYFGKNDNWTCPQCLKVFRDSGPKWQMTYRLLFSPEWLRLIADKDYGYVWMPDDDIVASACDIARFFDILENQQLYIAQMSVCPVEGSAVMWPHLFKRESNALRFTAFVEIMASALRFDFFQAVVRSTMGQSWTGWGLDTIWPFLLGYPPDGLAVVDAVCMVHAGRAGTGQRQDGSSNYAATVGSPWDNPWHEDDSVRAQWHVWPPAIAAMGIPPDIGGRGTKEFHSVPLAMPPPPPSPPSPPPSPPSPPLLPPAHHASGTAAAAAETDATAPSGATSNATNASSAPASAPADASVASTTTNSTIDPAKQAAARPTSDPSSAPGGASAWASTALSAAAARGREAAASPTSLLTVGALLAIALASSLAAVRAMRRRWQRRRTVSLYGHLHPGQSVQAGKMVSAAAFV